MAGVFLVKLPSEESHWTLVMISQHWFRQWLGAVRQQAIALANVDPDLCRHLVSLGHIELTCLKFDKHSHYSVCSQQIRTILLLWCLTCEVLCMQKLIRFSMFMNDKQFLNFLKILSYIAVLSLSSVKKMSNVIGPILVLNKDGNSNQAIFNRNW